MKEANQQAKSNPTWLASKINTMKNPGKKALKAGAKARHVLVELTKEFMELIKKKTKASAGPSKTSTVAGPSKPKSVSFAIISKPSSPVGPYTTVSGQPSIRERQFVVQQKGMFKMISAASKH